MESHLLQMRGLKQNYQRIIDQLNVVASFTDAWIETFGECIIKAISEVASFTDAWIETYSWPMLFNFDSSHLLQMRGLKP